MKDTYRERPFPPSLWSETAIPAPETRPLDCDMSMDVVVIGAGITGLSTALHLAEKNMRVCVLESEQAGWGASGRNGGQVIPGLKYDPDELKQRFGSEAGSVLNLAARSADIVFDLIKRYQIACDAQRNGWIQTAHTEKMLKVVEHRARQWEQHGAPVELLDRRSVSARIGTDRYVGGWIDLRAGSIQPLSYVRGLLRVAQELGVLVFSKSGAEKIKKQGEKWQVTTRDGHVVLADHVVIATNGYTDGIWPGLKKTVLTANSFVIATAPLPDSMDRPILSGREVSSDSRRLLVYFQRDHQGRLVLGGRGPFGNPQSMSEWAHIERAMILLFPQLKGISVDYRWAGRLAITMDFLPHIHEPESGVHILLGYCGRGVAMATALGAQLAQRISSDASSMSLPVTPLKPVPLHEFQRLYMSMGVAWYRLLDALS